MKRPPLVVITWTDARDLGETCEIVDVPRRVGLVERETSGFLVYEDPVQTILAHDFDAPSSVGNFTTIPTGWVKHVRHVQRKRRAAMPTPEETPNA